MENKIEFNWELYQSGLYDVVTRDGRKVEQLHKFDVNLTYPMYGVVNNNFNAWTIRGIDAILAENDLFLIPKVKEGQAPLGLYTMTKDGLVAGNAYSKNLINIISSADANNMIPQLGDGVLMEVSLTPNFSNPYQMNIVAKTKKGFYLDDDNKFWNYARPIKEVKECWVNVYEGNNGIYVVNQKEAKSFKSNFSDKYIKTIKITNEPDGETN